jgi:hypothetical protein
MMNRSGTRTTRGWGWGAGEGGGWEGEKGDAKKRKEMNSFGRGGTPAHPKRQILQFGRKLVMYQTAHCEGYPDQKHRPQGPYAIRLSACMWWPWSACMYVFMYVCMYVFMYLCLSVCLSFVQQAKHNTQCCTTCHKPWGDYWGHQFEKTCRGTASVCLSVCMYVCMYVFMCIYVYIYMCVCMYVCIYVCMYACMYFLWIHTWCMSGVVSLPCHQRDANNSYKSQKPWSEQSWKLWACCSRPYVYTCTWSQTHTLAHTHTRRHMHIYHFRGWYFWSSLTPSFCAHQRNSEQCRAGDLRSSKQFCEQFKDGGPRSNGW